jgi:hypothetical protein
MGSAEDESGEAETSGIEEDTEILDLPVKLGNVEVHPRDLQTRLNLILREFKPVKHAETLQDVAIRTEKALDALRDLGVFHHVEAVLGPGPAVCILEMCPCQLQHVFQRSSDAAVVTVTSATRLRVTAQPRRCAGHLACVFAAPVSMLCC